MPNPNKASVVRVLDRGDTPDRASTPETNAFDALTKRAGRPLRIAILSDFIRIPYANGTAFQTRFLYQELKKCGHEVTVIGPHDPTASPDDLAPGTVLLPSVPMKSYPGLHLPVPSASWIFDADRWSFDVCFAQTATPLVHFGLWLRKMRGTPLLVVNTTHLASAYDVLLPESLSRIEAVHAGLDYVCRGPYERIFRDVYNASDGLVVLSEGLKEYWRERGVTAPIHVIRRAVQPEVFDKPLGADPYPPRGPRLLCAGRLVREKSQDRAIRIFARHVLRHEPDATLTILGVGPELEDYKRVAKEMGVEDRVIFAGEVPFGSMSDWYAYADLFVHTSLSETYGNVLGEALWCGTPAVVFADGMGASQQVKDELNGLVLAPGEGAVAEAEADAAFGRAIVALLRDPQRRARLGKNAARHARQHCAPRIVHGQMAQAMIHAQEHAAACRLRGASKGPRALRWLTTLQHARAWALQQGGVYIAGHIRPARPSKVAIQPTLAT